MFEACLKEVSDVCQENLKGVSKSFQCISRLFNGSFKGVCKQFPSGFNRVLRKLQDSIHGISFQGLFNSVSRAFKLSFERVSRVISRMYQGHFMEVKFPVYFKIV